MKKNISITKHEYRDAVAKAEYMYDYLFTGKPLFASPNRAAYVVYEALNQITGGAIDADDFDAEFHKATMSDACPSRVEYKISFVMGWFEVFLGIDIIEEE